MTLPDERYAAVVRTREFLYDLIDPKKIPRIPKRVRIQALWCLRHFPNVYEMQETADKVPHIFTERYEPIQRMMLEYKEEQNGK